MSFSISNTEVAESFATGRAKAKKPVESTGDNLYYHGNHIAEWKEDGLYISNGGYVPNNGATGSLSTKTLLNALPNVSIDQRRKKWYLNGEEWDGSEIKVEGVTPPVINKEGAGDVISTRMTYVRTDAQRGYSEPVGAVCGANDTGTWDDSPCPSHIAAEELGRAMKVLKEAKIKYKRLTTETSNVFCVHHYLVTSENNKQRAKELIEPILEGTRLLYIA